MISCVFAFACRVVVFWYCLIVFVVVVCCCLSSVVCVVGLLLSVCHRFVVCVCVL